jgi:Ca2+-binding RTX toxin-like protein
MDVMEGNGGNDSYYVDSGGDRVQEGGNGGIDTVFSTVDWSLGANIERLVLLSPARKGVGNGLDNELLGNARDNWLDGGLGVDTLVGQSGNDTYVVNDIRDMVQEAAQGGVDTVLLKLGQAYQRYEMSENVERVLVQGRLATDVQGNAGGNSLLGNVGDNRLWGLDGDDVLSGGMGGLDFLYGGAGDDVYYVQHRKTLVLEIGDRGADAGGHDTVISRVEAYALGAYIEDLVLSGGGKKGWGNMLDNRLVGNVMDNELVGFGGDDVLAGGAGNDVLIGGSGEDWFLVDALGRGVDQWLDFDVSQGDKIGVKLTGAMRESLRGGLVDEAGNLSMGVVNSGEGMRVAQDADDRWLYDSGSGQLSWDADGIGRAQAELVAVLGTSGHRPQQLTSNDFFLFS